jgi:hypothetical protein
MSTHQPSGRLIDSSDAGTSAEASRLNAETSKLLAEAEHFRRVHRLEFWKALVSGATVAVALAGVLVTLNTQQQQIRQSEESRHVERVAVLAKEFSEGTTPRMRMGALIGLRGAMVESSDRSTIVSLLLNSIGSERDLNVRAAMAELLVSEADSAMLTEVAASNRRLLRQLDNYVGLDGDVPVLDPRFIGSREYRYGKDTTFRSMLESVAWTGDVLIRAINKLGRIRNQDFSEIAFTVPYVGNSVAYESSGEYLRLIPTTRLIEDVTFSNVDLSRSGLAFLRFSNVTFLSTSFSGANVYAASCTRCDFLGRTRLDSLSAMMEVDVPGPPGVSRAETTAHDVIPFRVDSSTLNVETFSVVGARPGPSPSDTAAEFVRISRSSWRVRGQLPSDTLGDFITLSSSGAHADVSLCVLYRWTSHAVWKHGICPGAER